MTVSNPRFDPIRNAKELGSLMVPSFYGDGPGAGTTDADTTKTTVWWDQLPLKRVLLAVLCFWIVWKLAK